MEIPKELKLLYKHWEKHTVKTSYRKSRLNIKELKKIESFGTERMLIWERRQKGETILTNDEVLKNYRFCNIYRELDKQTILIHKKLLPLVKNPDLWFLNILFCRFIARPETIEKIGLLSFDKKNNTSVMKKLINLKSPKYGVPYVFPISVIRGSAWPTRESFFCLYLPIVAKKCTKYLLSGNNSSTIEAVEKLTKIFGFNFRFHLTEAVIDFAYQYPKNINLFDLFPIGPGSMPTMKKLSSKLSPEEVCNQLISVELKSFPYLTFNKRKVLLSAENWEGIGCEYRKYTNLKKGLGRKRLYRK